MCRRCWPPPDTLGEAWCFLWFSVHWFTSTIFLLKKKKTLQGSPPFLEFLPFSPFWCRSTCTPQFSTPTHSSSFHPSTLSTTVIVWENTVFGTASVFGGDRSCPIRCPANISARRIFVFSWLRDPFRGEATFCLSQLPSNLSSPPRPFTDKLWFIVARFNHFFCIREPKHVVCFEPKAAIVSKGRGSISQQAVSMARFPEARSQCGQDNSGILLQASSVTKHVCPPHGRSRRRPQPNL